MEALLLEQVIANNDPYRLWDQTDEKELEILDRPMNNKIKFFSTLVLLFIVHIGYGQNSNKPIKVLIVDGFSNHDWEQTTKITKQILEKSKLFNVAISTAPVSFEDTSWNPNFKDYEVVIQNTNNINNKEIKWPKKVQEDLEAYVKSGGGLYILHSANNAFSDWKEYNLMIGLGWRSKYEGVALQVKENGAPLEIPIGEGKSTYHGRRNDAVIHILNDHPINNGFNKAWKTPDMELYKFARGPAKNLTVLSYSKDEQTGINWPVEWVVSYGKGKVYNSSMGHLWKGQTYPISYRCIGFQTSMIRTTEWLATGKVTYSVPDNFPTEKSISVLPE